MTLKRNYFRLILCLSFLTWSVGHTLAQSSIIQDSLFKEPYVDIDEWRDQPVRHRYVHGGFKGTDTRFSFYFPPNEQYQGRFFQYITPFSAPILVWVQDHGHLRVFGSLPRRGDGQQKIFYG